MLDNLLLAFWFLLPAGLANMAPVFAAHLPVLKHLEAPMDGGRKFRGKPVLGPNKTWRGLISGMVIATLILYLQQLAAANYQWAQAFTVEVDYSLLPTLILGPLFGLGALGGDAIESFFKRQAGRRSGDSWLPYDQIDYVLGGILVSLPFVQLEIMLYLLMILLYCGLHIAVSYVGWLVGLKAKPI